MPPAAEKTDAPAAAPPAHAPMFSPVGIVVVLIVLVVEGVVVFLVARGLGAPGGPKVGEGQKPMIIDLGHFQRDLPVGEESMRINETVSMQVSLLLNPEFDDMDKLKEEVESWKPVLISHIDKLLYLMPKKYFFESHVREDLERTVLTEMNQILKRNDGHPRVKQVLLSKTRFPSQR